MTHGVGSSSVVSGSSAAAQQSKVFDIASESGLLALLRAVHRSDATQAHKNELRDLLFDFKNGDGSRREFVKRALADAGFEVAFGAGTAETEVPVAASEPKADEPEPTAPAKQSFGRARFAPKFSTAAAASAPATPPAATPSELPEPQAEPEPKTTESEPATPSVSPLQPKDSAPVATPSEPPAEVTPPPVPEPAPAAPVVEPTTTPDGDAAMERIKEIKRLVNEKVGNPVTLIDIDNQIGREYMNALLGAMKVINGGRPNDLKAAMDRLEKAYQAAITIAENSPPPETVTDSFVNAANAAPEPPQTAAPAATPPAPVAPASATPPVAPAATPVTPPSPSSVPQPAVTPLSSAAQMPNQPAATTPPAPATPPPASAAPTPTLEPNAAAPAGNPVKINVSPGSADAAERAAQGFAAQAPAPTNPPPASPTPQAEPAQSVPIMSKLAAVESALKSDVVEPPQMAAAAPAATPPAPAAPAPATPPVPAPAAEANSARLMSVAKEEQLQNLMRQNQAKEAQQKQAAEMAERSNSDPLMLPEVTAGLKQLLSEWGLFKGSGFFGTGPSGVDHPLYQKVANLTMAAVIAGRFEGATPEVKQSITDYMNGWRYEEGIVHEHTETFEHYLRRVIRHILDQKKVGGV